MVTGLGGQGSVAPATLRNWVAPGFSDLMQHLAVPLNSTVSRPQPRGSDPAALEWAPGIAHETIIPGILNAGGHLGRAPVASPGGSPAASASRTTSAVPELERALRFPGDGGGRSGAMTSKSDGSGEARRLGPPGGARLRAPRPPSDVCFAPKTFTGRLPSALARAADPANPSDRRHLKVKPASAGGWGPGDRVPGGPRGRNVQGPGGAPGACAQPASAQFRSAQQARAGGQAGKPRKHCEGLGYCPLGSRGSPGTDQLCLLVTASPVERKVG